MATTHINYLSDFAVEITLLDSQGNVLTPPSWDWTLTFKVGTRKYECSQKDGELCSCKIDGDKVLCYLDNHHFGIGTLEAQFTQLIPDGNYADGNHKIVTPQELDIELWADANDTDGTLSADISTCFVYADLYALAVQNGYTGTEEEYFALLSNPHYINEAESGYNNGLLTLKIE